MHSNYARVRHLQCKIVQATWYKSCASLYTQLHIKTVSTLGGSDAVKSDIRIPLMPKLNVLAFICMDTALSALHQSIRALFKSSYITACNKLTKKHLSTYKLFLVSCRKLQGTQHGRFVTLDDVI